MASRESSTKDLHRPPALEKQSSWLSRMESSKSFGSNCERARLRRKRSGLVNAFARMMGWSPAEEDVLKKQNSAKKIAFPNHLKASNSVSRSFST